LKNCSFRTEDNYNITLTKEIFPKTFKTALNKGNFERNEKIAILKMIVSFTYCNLILKNKLKKNSHVIVVIGRQAKAVVVGIVVVVVVVAL